MAQKFHHDIEIVLHTLVFAAQPSKDWTLLCLLLLIIIITLMNLASDWVRNLGRIRQSGKIFSLQVPTVSSSSSSSSSYFVVVAPAEGCSAPPHPHSFPRYCMTVTSYEIRTSGNLIPTLAEFPGDWSESPTPCLFIYPSICLSLPSSVAAAAAC